MISPLNESILAYLVTVWPVKKNESTLMYILFYLFYLFIYFFFLKKTKLNHPVVDHTDDDLSVAQGLLYPSYT